MKIDMISIRMFTRRSVLRAALAAAALTALLCSCRHDEPVAAISDGIAFTVLSGSGYAPQAKSADDTPSAPEGEGGTPSLFDELGVQMQIEGGLQFTHAGDTIAMRVATRDAETAGRGATKGIRIPSGSLPDTIDIGLTARTYPSGASESSWALYPAGVPCLKAVNDRSRGADYSSGKWVPVTRMLWPGGKSNRIRFFAYAPYGDNVTLSTGSVPHITGYSVPDARTKAAVAAMKDLLVTDHHTESHDYPGAPDIFSIDVPLTMMHALTAVRFRVGADLTIKSVKISGINNNGTFNMASLAWGSASGSGTYELTGLAAADLVDDTTLGDSGYKILKDEYTFLLLPQTLPSGATITATVTDGVGDKEITANIAGALWKPNQEIIYTITSSAITYTFSVADELGNTLGDITLFPDETIADTIRNLTVKSYRTSNVSGETAVPWTVQFSTDGGATWSSSAPQWLKLYEDDGTTVSAGGSGGSTGEGKKIFIANNKSSKSPTVHVNVGEDYIATLRNATPVGTKTAPIDLSLHNIYGEHYSTQTSIPQMTGKGPHTSNCYVISAPGWYCLPLVYGNAIDATRGSGGSHIHDAAYGAQLGDGIPWFDDKDGNDVTTPYVLSASEYVADRYDAVVVWQDVAGGFEVIDDAEMEVIPASSLTGVGVPGASYIRFYIAPGATDYVANGTVQSSGYRAGGILPCNILIALRDKTSYDASSDNQWLKNPRILWSWHLWVTPVKDGGLFKNDFDLMTLAYRESVSDWYWVNSDIATVVNGSVTFLNCNLGWTPPLYFYHGGTQPLRSCKVRFVQSEGGGIRSLDVVQNEGPFTPSDGGEAYNSTHYQWGRKDPAPPAAGWGSHTRVLARTVASNHYSIIDRTDPIEKWKVVGRNDLKRHSYPGAYSEQGFSGRLNNATYNGTIRAKVWDLSGSFVNDTKKTIYDPSPAGFCVPFLRAFSGFAYSINWGGEPLRRLYAAQYAGKGLIASIDGTDSGPKSFYLPYVGTVGGGGYRDYSLFSMLLSQTEEGNSLENLTQGAYSSRYHALCESKGLVQIHGSGPTFCGQVRPMVEGSSVAGYTPSIGPNVTTGGQDKNTVTIDNNWK